MNVKNAVFASAVAALFAASPALAKDKTHAAKGEAAVKCTGANSCKGTSACSGADNSCKAQNSCKGKGWTEAKSAKACTDKGGTVVVAAKE